MIVYINIYINKLGSFFQGVETEHDLVDHREKTCLVSFILGGLNRPAERDECLFVQFSYIDPIKHVDSTVMHLLGAHYRKTNTQRIN